MALLWAVLVILTAIQFVGTSEKDDSTTQARQGASADPAPGTLIDQQKTAINSVF